MLQKSPPLVLLSSGRLPENASELPGRTVAPRPDQRATLSIPGFGAGAQIFLRRNWVCFERGRESSAIGFWVRGPALISS